MTTKDVAEKTGLSIRRVQQAAPLYAKKNGRDWYWSMSGIEKLLKQKGKSGRPKKDPE